MNENDLRDCFAMFALAGLLMRGNNKLEDIAEGSYALADHMLEGIIRLRISNGICGRTAYNARQDFEEIGDGINKQLLLSLKYKGKEGEPVITSLKRISRPGLRVYANRKELPRVLGGLGVAIISTSKGVLTDNKARHQGLGGEVVCYIW
jgi:hypothetical protein